MNIFYLDEDPINCAKYLCDQHLRKMIVETAQLLSNCWPEDIAPYKRFGYNHPCSKWAQYNRKHYVYLVELFHNYLGEFEYRFNKGHKCAELNFSVAAFGWFDKNFEAFQKPPQVMPAMHVDSSTVVAYRNYYRDKMTEWQSRDKKIIPKWTNRAVPGWLEGVIL